MPTPEERQKYIETRMKNEEPVDKLMGAICLVGIGGFLLFRAITDRKHDERDRSIKLPG